MRRERLGFIFTFSCLSLAVVGCATTPQTSSPASLTVDRSADIVIAADGQGVGTSWSSITDSPVARTVAELSNLGGAPVVLGAVGVALAADAAPRGRARRLTEALNGTLGDEIDPDALDRDLAERIGDALDADVMTDAPADLSMDDPPVVRVKAFERSADLEQEGFIIDTGYALARDGSALRVRADIVHADMLALEREIERELRRLEMARDGYGTMRPSLRRLRRLMRERAALARLHRRRIVFHSDPLDRPAAVAMNVATPGVMDDVAAALDAERNARQAVARADHAEAMAKDPDPREAAKADRRLDRALAKADRIHAKGLARIAKTNAGEELDKMDPLLLAMDGWTDETPDGDTELMAAVEEAHAFIADRVGAIFGDDDADRKSGPPVELDGGRLLDRDADGRMTLLITEGPQSGTVMSLPASGEADYGRSVARP
ncbi:MAG: hypothetical protein AAF311_11950 [Pseudomonadota bacterium]